MPTIEQAIAVATDGTHNTLHQSAIAYFVLEKVKIDSTDLIIDNKKWTNFKRILTEAFYFREAQDDLTPVNEVVDYLKQRCAEPIDHYDKVTYYSHTQKEEISLSLSLNQIVQYIFEILEDKENTYFTVKENEALLANPETHEKEEDPTQRQRNERLYSLFNIIKNLQVQDK